MQLLCFIYVFENLFKFKSDLKDPPFRIRPDPVFLLFKIRSEQDPDLFLIRIRPGPGFDISSLSFTKTRLQLL